MDLTLSEEQHALRAMAGDVFAKLYPSTRLRELWGGAQRGRDAWRAMAEVGLAGLTVDQHHGGSGGGPIDCIIVLEQAGRACVPEPLVDTVAVAAPLLARSAPAPVQERWLPAIAAGDALVSVQLAGQPFVIDADLVDLLLVEIDGGMHAVTADGFIADPVPAEDPTRRLFHVDYEVGQRVGEARHAADLAALGSAAVLNGIGTALLERSVQYVTIRHQFGRPVGSFQAVQHKLASVHARLESSRAATLLAGHAVATDDAEASVAVAAAKILAVEAQALANTEALQCHAGIAFTWEHDLHFWLKRGRALEHAYGSAAQHRAAIAARLLGDGDVQ